MTDNVVDWFKCPAPGRPATDAEGRHGGDAVEKTDPPREPSVRPGRCCDAGPHSSRVDRPRRWLCHQLG